MRGRAGRKLRADQALVDRRQCSSREQAKRLILAGAVYLRGQRVEKPGGLVSREDVLTIREKEKYVSRGGHKLERALDCFRLDLNGWTVIDLGASTGGFTDCALQRGAAKVYAVDVGTGQLAWKLRQDPRVIVMEKTNARYLTSGSFPPPFHPVDFIVIDCSFISLKLILPAAAELLKPGGELVALIKPQFEAGKVEVDKGAGVIQDPLIHQSVLEDIRTFVNEHTTLNWKACAESPLLGPAGNKEFLARLEKTSRTI